RSYPYSSWTALFTFFFFQAEDGIRDWSVTGVQTCALPIFCQGRADRRAVREIQRLVRARGIDLMHTHGYKADIYGYLAARSEDTPLVATCHNWLAGGAALAAYNFLDRMALKRFDAVCAVSPAIAQELVSLGLHRDRVTVIPNGIDVTAFDATPIPSHQPPQSHPSQLLAILAPPA